MNRAVRGVFTFVNDDAKIRIIVQYTKFGCHFFIPFYCGENFVALIGNKCGGIALIS